MKLQTFKVGDKTCVALIRKLTERECGRLMGVDDEDITTIQQSGVSRSLRSNCVQPTISGKVNLYDTTSSSVYTAILDIYEATI